MMKLWIRMVLLFAGVSLWSAFCVAVPLEELFEAVASFECGQDEKPLIEVAEEVRRSVSDPGRRQAVEDGLIAVLKTGTVDAKRFACRQLWIAASDRALPALTTLLADEDLSDTARFALERLETPAAAKAMRDGIAKVKGKALVGVVNSVGQRRDAQAVPLLLPLLKEPDTGVVAAAAWALGRIGGKDVVRGLETARAETSGPLQRELEDAILMCADRLAEAGEQSDAAAVYQQVYDREKTVRLRVAALQGLAVTRPGQAVTYALAALNSENVRMRAGAGGLIRELPGTAITQSLAQGLPALSTEGQIMMLGVLGYRGDAAALPAVRAAAQSHAEDAVRVAAIQALGEIGTGQDVSLLVALCLDTSPDVGREAQSSLRQMKDAGFDRALVGALDDSKPAAQATILQALGARRAVSAAPAVMPYAMARDPSVRRAALDALADLAGANELTGLVGLLLGADADRDRASAAEAIRTILDRTVDKSAASRVLIQALATASEPARLHVLALLPSAPAPEALAELRKAAEAGSPMQTDAIRAMAKWPDSDVLGDLMELARATDGSPRVLAIRGCVRILSLPSRRTVQQTLDEYSALLQIATRVEEKRMILAGMSTLAAPEALERVESFMHDPELSQEANMAAVSIARDIGGSDMELAVRTLKRIAGAATTGSVKAAAQDAIRQLDRHQGYITSWMMAGPYTLDGSSGANLCDTVFGPERTDARDVKWVRVSTGGDVMVDLREALGGENRAAYLRAAVESADQQDVIVELGSDDGIKAWLNGSVILVNNAARSFRPGDDRVRVTLNAGRNVLMLKVINGGTDWAASARLTTPRGGIAEGLKMKAE